MMDDGLGGTEMGRGAGLVLAVQQRKLGERDALWQSLGGLSTRQGAGSDVTGHQHAHRGDGTSAIMVLPATSAASASCSSGGCGEETEGPLLHCYPHGNVVIKRDPKDGTV